MKKIIVALLSLTLILSCSGKKEKSENGEKTIRIGISKIVAHPALDATEAGIIEAVKAVYPDAVFDLQNANGEISNATSIAQKFKKDQVDIAIGIATPTAQALAAILEDIPVIYSAVTDPVAAELVASYTEGEKGITGVSDLAPVEAQIATLNKMVAVKSLGHIYNSSEANSVVLKDMAKKYCEENGIKFVEAVATNTGEVQQAALSLVGEVDAIYLSTDNTVYSALATILEVADNNNIPVMGSSPENDAEMGMMTSLGFDYKKIGLATGKAVLEVLNGKNTEEMPVIYLTDPSDLDFVINKKITGALNLSVSEELLKKASRIIE